MADVYMLFTDPLALGIAEGRKTVTRRPIAAANSTVWLGDKQTKPLADLMIKAAQTGGSQIVNGAVATPGRTVANTYFPPVFIRPRHAPGDTLIVKECWGLHFLFDSLSPSQAREEDPDCVFYRADGPDAGAHRVPVRVPNSERAHIGGGCVASQRKVWRPSIHMPRWAARSVRKIVSVAPERLGPLSQVEAEREGFGSPDEFAAAWAAIYGDRTTWVWRYEFANKNEVKS